jgi:cellulase
VQVYLSKVANAATADPPTSGWFKIFSNSWTKKTGGGSGDDDFWGTKDLNSCCGKMDVKIPTDIAAGDYLLRAEALALHTAGSSGGAQFYMSCYQITVDGGSTSSTGSGLAVAAAPATVSIPGMYKASDPGILVNIHAALANYVTPGPALYAGGTSKTAGSGCSGCASTCKAGAKTTGGGKTGSTPDAVVIDTGSAAAAGAAAVLAPAAPADAAACSVAAFGQCGGNGYSGCTTCAGGFTCKAVSPPYYSQCVAISQ